METTSNKITIQAEVNAPIDKVWKFYTEPEHITQWGFASDDWHAPYADNDLRVGGKFTTTMAAKDGSMSFDFGGEYYEVEDQHLIAYKIGDGRDVRVEFTSEGDKTQITAVFDADDVYSAEQQRFGWQSILDNFKKHVEAE